MRKFSSIFFFILTASAAGTVFGQETPAPLTLTLKPERQTVAFGEPFRFDLSLSNTGPRTIHLNTWIFHHPEMLKARVHGPDGPVPETIHIKYDMKMREHSDFVLLNPRNHYQTTISSGGPPYHFLGHELTRPGEYRIQVVYSNEDFGEFFTLDFPVYSGLAAWTGTVVSDPAAVVLTENTAGEQAPSPEVSLTLSRGKLDPRGYPDVTVRNHADHSIWLE